MKTIKNLTELEKGLFQTIFYDLSPVNDLSSPCPWGMPWIWCKTHIEKETVTELALEYYRLVREEIEAHLEREKERD